MGEVGEAGGVFVTILEGMIHEGQTRTLLPSYPRSGVQGQSGVCLLRLWFQHHECDITDWV